MTELTPSDRVAANIRKYRKQRGWSMAQLAERCGLSEDVIQHIETGRRDKDGRRRRHVTVEELEVISAAFWGSAGRISVPLLQDPDWEERNLEKNQEWAAEREAMLKEPAIAEALEAELNAADAHRYLQARLHTLVEDWRRANA